MASILVPVLLMAVCAFLMALGMFVSGQLLGPRQSNDVKQMPYESGMDPVHDARRRFDIRFHAMAIVFLVFDVELLFLYPWAVANKDPEGLARFAESTLASGGVSLAVVFAEVMVFVGLLAVGFIYAWRRGVFRWR